MSTFDDDKEKALEEIFAWRKAEKKKPRIMTSSQYMAWVRGGDAISHPSETRPFPGGLTIVPDETPLPVIGRTVEK